MSEEYGNDFVTLIDEDGNEVAFEHIDTVDIREQPIWPLSRQSFLSRKTQRS